MRAVDTLNICPITLANLNSYMTFVPDTFRHMGCITKNSTVSMNLIQVVLSVNYEVWLLFTKTTSYRTVILGSTFPRLSCRYV
jgi:hypothetical protein